MTSGLSKGKGSKSAKCKQPPPAIPQAVLSFSPRRQPTIRDPLTRAEERMVQDALKASLQDSAEALSPLKSMPDGASGLLTRYNSVLKAQGRT